MTDFQIAWIVTNIGEDASQLSEAVSGKTGKKRVERMGLSDAEFEKFNAEAKAESRRIAEAANKKKANGG